MTGRRRVGNFEGGAHWQGQNHPLLFAAVLSVAAALPHVSLAQAPLAGAVDLPPGVIALPVGTIATIVFPPGINGRIGPGASSRRLPYPVAGQLVQGAIYRAALTSDPTISPACSRGWIQIRALDADQNVLGNHRDLWICKGDGNAIYALISSNKPNAAAPTTPAGIVVSAVSSSAINLNWNAAVDRGGSGLAGYKIERCTGSGCSDFRQIVATRSPPYSDSGLSANTSYAYRVRAYDNAGNNGDYSDAVLATTMLPLTSLPDLVVSALNAPAAAAIGGQITISAAVTNQGARSTGPYRLGFYFSTDQRMTIGGAFTGTYCDMPALAAGSTWPCSGPVVTPTWLTPGVYYLGAIADDLGQVAESSKDNNTSSVLITLNLPPDNTAPTAPAGLVATAVSASAISLRWNASTDNGGSGLAGYKIERCAGSGCTNFRQIATAVSPLHTDTNLDTGTTYVYRVLAYDNAGNNSNYPTAVAATTVPTATLLRDPSSRQ